MSKCKNVHTFLMRLLQIHWSEQPKFQKIHGWYNGRWIRYFPINRPMLRKSKK